MLTDKKFARPVRVWVISILNAIFLIAFFIFYSTAFVETADSPETELSFSSYEELADSDEFPYVLRGVKEVISMAEEDGDEVDKIKELACMMKREATTKLYLKIVYSCDGDEKEEYLLIENVGKNSNVEFDIEKIEKKEYKKLRKSWLMENSSSSAEDMKEKFYDKDAISMIFEIALVR